MGGRGGPRDGDRTAAGFTEQVSAGEYGVRTLSWKQEPKRSEADGPEPRGARSEGGGEEEEKIQENKEKIMKNKEIKEERGKRRMETVTRSGIT